MKFKDYLATIHSLLEKSHPKRYVIGNSSADFDSIFGSLIYAFFLTSQLGQTYLPIIDCNKTDIPLRFDVNFIMKRLNIDYHKLLYTSDIDYLDK
jgi:exopolyphosphatase